MATSEATLQRTNERAGTRAKLRNLPTSAYKVREVLDLIRGEDVVRAEEILRFCTRGPATPVAKLLHSAVSNAVTNDGMDREELFVSACFADEGVTAKRWRPRARGRAGRIRKRSSHITIIVSRLPEARLERLRQEQAKQDGSRRRRVAGSRAARTAASKKKDQELASDVEEDVIDSAVDESPAEEQVSPAAEKKSKKPAAKKEADETAGSADDAQASESTSESATNEEEK